MTVADFLSWCEHEEGKFDLHRGEVVAIAPPPSAHGQITANAVAVLYRQKKLPCRVVTEAGVAIEGDDTLYQPELVVGCSPHVRGQRITPDPVVIIEVLSESAERKDRRIKLPDYGTIPSVKEIVLVDPERPLLEIHRRAEQDRWYVDFAGGLDAVALLDSIAARLPLAEFYDGIELEP